MLSKLDNTIARLAEWFEKFDQPVIMSSFGKDSMAMLFIVFRIMEKKPPVIYHGSPWDPWKNDFAQSIIKLWHLEVYDYLPIASGIKVKPDRLELVHRYQTGMKSGIDIPVNVLPPPVRKVTSNECGLHMVSRPKGSILYQWNLTLIGHKSCDVDQFDGEIPLKSDLVEINGVTIGFPLKDWSDEELWEFIEKRRVPVQYGTRYIDRKEIECKDFNLDYIEACTACIDPRNPERVFCPLVNESIKNVSAGILKFEGKPSYLAEATK